MTSEQMQAFHEACVANLDDTYELVYVDYRDRLTDEQVAMLMRDDMEALYDSIAEWESDSRWEGTKYVLEEVVKDTAREWETRDDRDYSDLADEYDTSALYEELREEIEQRDNSDPIKQLAGQTPAVLCRHIVIDEDDAYAGHLPLTRSQVIKDLGIKRNKRNLKVVGDILAEAYYPGTYLFGNLVYAISPADVLEAGEDDEIEIVNPHLWLGNIFAGSGDCEGPLDGTFRIKRNELRTDKDAPGYGWDEVAGVVTSYYETEIRIIKHEETAA